MISIQPLTIHEHISEVASLERRIWGYGDLDLDSPNMLTVTSRFTGQLIGSFDDGRLIGLALSFATLSPGRLHSHRVGVLPEYQNKGIGRQLKLAQREDALAKGMDTIQWTFDPLQARNAHFNLVRLGGIAKSYIPNLYGITSSPLHGGLPTDRLLIEWHLQSPRVCQIIAGISPQASGDVCQIDLPAPDERRKVTALERLREEFTRRLGEGFLVAGFQTDNERSFYILERA
ncbi:MAG: GNAT family N-acetyltransferase [Edaphobacter sp.]